MYEATFEPAELVRVQGFAQQGDSSQRLRKLVELFGIYTTNVILYAGPLSLSGTAGTDVPSRPSWFTVLPFGLGSESVWRFMFAVVQNSLFLLVATLLALVTFHMMVTITFQSEGFLSSANVVIYSTSLYLTGMFTVVWYLSNAPAVDAARTLLIAVQQRFVNTLLDLMGTNLQLPGEEVELVSLASLSQTGSLLIAVFIVLAFYFLYSLYLGCRINHDTDRITALIVVLAVVSSPVIYVAGLIVVNTQLDFLV